MIEIDLAQSSVRELNQLLHRIGSGDNEHYWVVNPNGAHAIAVGLGVFAAVIHWCIRERSVPRLAMAAATA